MNDEQRERARKLLSQDMTATDNAASDARSEPSEPVGGFSVNWRELDDNQAHAEWVALRAFVEWLTVRYHLPVSMVPNCWWQHGDLVEELSALHAAHQAAFDETDAGFGPLNWHERFATAQARLRNSASGCTSTHDGFRPRSWSNVTDEQEWHAWTNRSHAEQPPRAAQRREG